MNELAQVLASAREDYTYGRRYHGARCVCLLCEEKKRDRLYDIHERVDEYGNKIIESSPAPYEKFNDLIFEHWPALTPEENYGAVSRKANKILVTPTEVQLPVPSGATIMQWIGWGGTAIVVLVHLSRLVGA